MRLAAAALLLLGCHRAPKAKAPEPAPTPDAGVPDANVPDAMPDAPPPRITFAPAPWTAGQEIRVWHRTVLSRVPGSSDLTSEDTLTLTVTGDDGATGLTVTIADDCHATIAHGTAKVTGDCGGGASDVAYKLDLAAQLLAVPRGTMAVGDACTGFGRPLVGLFRLQDAGAIVRAHLASADDAGATYALHADLDGTMLRPGLHVLGALDGELHVDAAARAMTGTLRSDRVVVSGYPQADFSAKGALELSFGIEPK